MLPLAVRITMNIKLMRIMKGNMPMIKLEYNN